MPFLDIGDLAMYYELHGDPDAPNVLMISGTGNDLRTSFPDRNPVNKVGNVCHFDQRGLGQTDIPDGPYTMAQYADDAAGLVAELGWSTCHVVGTSFGGMVALNLAERHPELIERLVLNCTSPGGDFASFPLHTLTGAPAEELLDRRMRLTDERYDPEAEQPLPDIARSVFDAMVARAASPATGQAAAGARRQLEARSSHDTNHVLSRITNPTLVCAGRYDHIAPMANSEKLANEIPDAVLRVFEGGHLFMLQDRTAFAAINTFLSSGER